MSTEAAWQAGIVDGEGCLTLGRQIRKGRPSPAFRESVTVSNTDKRLLEPFHSMWGGTLYRHEEKRAQWSTAYTWHCSVSQVKAFLLFIRPYLRGKRAQADLLLLFIYNKKSFKRRSLGQGFGSAPLSAAEVRFREGLWNEIRLLNSKGRFSRNQRIGATERC